MIATSLKLLGQRGLRLWALLTLVSIVGLPAAGHAGGNKDPLAKFRVIDTKINPGGKTATATILWNYNDGGRPSYNGKGVEFYLHRSVPSHFSAATGTRVGTVDMKNGHGKAKITFDLKQTGSKAGEALVLAARWPAGHGHEWGTSLRPGGNFSLPKGLASQSGAAGIANLKLRRQYRTANGAPGQFSGLIRAGLTRSGKSYKFRSRTNPSSGVYVNRTTRRTRRFSDR